MIQYRTRDFILPASQQICEVREADGNAEQILWDNINRIDRALPRYWAGLINHIGDIECPTPKQFQDLVEPDRIAISIEIFRATVPNDVLVLSGECPGCGEPDGYEVDLGALDNLPLPLGAEPPDPTFSITLPRSGQKVLWGYRTGHDEVEELRAKGFDPTRQTWKAIRTIDGSDKFHLRDILAWPIEDHRALRQHIAENMCGYDTRVRFTHDCGRARTVNLLSDPSFLMPGLVRL